MQISPAAGRGRADPGAHRGAEWPLQRQQPDRCERRDRSSRSGGLPPPAAGLDLDVRLADRLADWIDRDLEPNFPDGAEDSEYLSRQPPFRAANRPITSVSEILLVYPEIGAAGYDRLRPYITALPRGTLFNINTPCPKCC
jgi:hypothetical protein